MCSARNKNIGFYRWANQFRPLRQTSSNALAKIAELMEQFSLGFLDAGLLAMNLQIFFTTLLLVFALGLAKAQDADAASSGNTRTLAPVNQVSHFRLSNALPHLTGNLAGLMQNSLVLRPGEFQMQDQTITTQVPEAHGKQAVWVQMNNYWIEPITPPPSHGEALMVPIDDMRIAEAQGEVTLLEFKDNKDKSAKAKPIEVNQDMELPDQATLCTADTGSAAIMIGGHTSVRLVPNSRAQFHYDISGETPRLEVKILQGAAFCKVGRLPSGRAPDVAVHGQVGSTATIGSCDFFAQGDPVSLHICLVRGRLLIGDAIPLAVGNMDWYPADAEADGLSGPQISHWPRPVSVADKNLMDAQVLGFALHQAKDLNVKIKALLDSTETPLSSEDQDYLAHIPRITWYERAIASP